jgi:hypothetical protein
MQKYRLEIVTGQVRKRFCWFGIAFPLPLDVPIGPAGRGPIRDDESIGSLTCRLPASDSASPIPPQEQFDNCAVKTPHIHKILIFAQWQRNASLLVSPASSPAAPSAPPSARRHLSRLALHHPASPKTSKKSSKSSRKPVPAPSARLNPLLHPQNPTSGCKSTNRPTPNLHPQPRPLHRGHRSTRVQIQRRKSGLRMEKRSRREMSFIRI